MKDHHTRHLLEIALTVALAAVLSMYVLWRMPQGGTVSLGMLPLFVLALRSGLWAGLAAGGLFGIVTMMIDPYPPVHWVQPILDYPVAHLLVGLAGAFSGPLSRALTGNTRYRALALIAGGIALGTLGRYLAHWTSGVVFFGEYAPPGQPVWLYSALYNLYVPVSAAGCLAAALAVVPALERIVPRGRAGRRT